MKQYARRENTPDGKTRPTGKHTGRENTPDGKTRPTCAMQHTPCEAPVRRSSHLVQHLLQGCRVGGNLQGFVAGDLAVVDKSNQVIV